MLAGAKPTAPRGANAEDRPLLRRCFSLFLTGLTAWLLAAPTLSAQGQYSPEVQVGTSVITAYQIDQRTRFLSLLGAPGDARTLAREQLINEAIQLAAAREQGVTATPETIEAGITDFAARANLTPEQFLAAIGQAGVSPATFRDFITAGVVWRDTIRARFGEELRASITPIQISRSLSQTGTEGGLRVLISEILLPTTTPETAQASRARAATLSALPNEAAFAAAARQFSVAASAQRGGEINWVALETLPEDVRGSIAALVPGQITRPLELGNAIGLFLMRDVERFAAGTPETLAVDYALFIVSGGLAEAEKVANRVDVCDDFYGVAKGLPEDRLIRETTPSSALPADIRNAVDRLDEGETSTDLTRSGNATVLMLCERKPGLESTVDADIIANRLLNARLGVTAQHYLTELRATTEVIDLTN